jgi:outer membrane lipoprotein-sorting protein
MTALVSTLALLTASAADPDASDIVQKTFRDATMEVRVVQANFAELRKISDDFDKQYRVKSLKLSLKEPLMLRIEGKVEDTTVLYIVNGFKRVSKIPRSNINIREDLSDAPGKIQTPMDSGVISSAVLATLFDAKYVRTDRATGNYVFDLTYKRPRFTDTSRHRVWVDPQKRYIERREVYNQYGRQLATYYYENAKEFAGVWIPTRASVRNVDGKVAGVTEVASIKVNAGLNESLFSVR